MSFCTGSILLCNTKDTEALLKDDKFLALEEAIEILPRFSSDEQVECLKSKFGPFRAGIPAKVPLWAALEMARLQQCKIELPMWLQEESMKISRDEEKAATKELLKPPHEFYIEIAFALLTQSTVFSDNTREKDTVKLILRELMDERRNKITNSMLLLSTELAEFNVSNMSAAELTCFRTRSFHAMDSFGDLLKGRRVAHREEFNLDDVEGTQQEDSSSLPPL
eukprot:TRINITY_DN67967_c0_g1_i1.p1 TRINITY_DN67967_c0_g1~~TRINITY_DN67967_c0_g1_i1.p1  ORF type:complete len:223 (-),score=59.36 TRINITY_DN67967_c0_g1_i1:54-722(-)